MTTAGIGAVMALSGCEGSGGGQTAAMARLTGSVTHAGVTVSVTPRDGSTGVLPSDQVIVTVKGGSLRDVTVVGMKGAPLAGSISHRTTWRSKPGQLLRYGATYSVYVDAFARNEDVQSFRTSFRVIDRSHTLRPAVAPFPNETVGVGMPVMVYFGARVRDKAAVERAMTVTSTHRQRGAWHWFGDREAHYRPRTYWRAGDVVRVDLRLTGVQAGGGVRGVANRRFSFRIGPSHVSRVDARTHRMAVYTNGRLVRSLPVSTGRDKYPSMSGVHLVVEKTKLQIMDSETVGIPRKSKDGYYEKVPFSTRISYSGEFVHSAPWSLRDQGRRNVSHGCVNVSPKDAEWFYNLSRRGDVVVISGTPKPYPQGSGFQDWTYSWAEWLRGSALAH